jgi:hypothetical protein
MRIRWVVGWAALGIAVASCSSAGGSEVDRALSAQVRPQFARCLGLPIESVEIEVDSQRRAVRTQWVDDLGDGPDRSAEECLEILGIDRFGQ